MMTYGIIKSLHEDPSAVPMPSDGKAPDGTSLKGDPSKLLKAEQEGSGDGILSGDGVLALSIALSVSVPAFAEDEPAEDRVVAPTKELTIVSWGGSYTRSQMLAYVKPYRLLSGEWVSMETYNGGLQQIREQVETENVIWDVVDFELSDLIRGCREGLLETIDHSTLPPGGDGTPAAEDFISGAFTQCGIGRPCGRQL